MRRLNVHIIERQLNKLCQKLSEEYDINSGGCCYIAYEIAKHLDKIGLKYELRIYDSYRKNQEAINSEVRTKHKNNSSTTSVVGIHSCSHYFLYLSGAGPINQDAEFFSGLKYYSITNINHKNILWIYRIGLWNSEYNRLNNPKIRKIINSYFRPYEQAFS